MKRKRNQLIPFDKSKRIIYLDKRGRGKKHSVGALIFAVLGVLCLLYCLSIVLFMGYGTSFFLIWGAMAVGFGILSLVLYHPEWRARIPFWLKAAFVICSVMGILLFSVVEGMILSQFRARAAYGADYMIILGAQWKENGPSYVLQKRLDQAITYLQSSPETIVIVSGGQGANEPITEASGMKAYLMEKGIAETRILMEDQSTNTYENLVFSAEFLRKENNTVVLVTNNFHVFRAVQIAEKQGYENVEGLAAASYPWMLPNNLLREFLGVLKDFIVGNA